MELVTSVKTVSMSALLRTGLCCLAIATASLTGCESDGLDSDRNSKPLLVDTLLVSADARVASSQPDAAFGLEDELVVGTVVYAGGPTYVNRSLVALPVPPLPLDSIEFSSATLVLTYQDALDTLSSPVAAHLVSESWDEASVTWYSQPAVDSTAFQTVSVQNHQLRFNVASLYLDSTFASGIMLKSDAADIWLHSHESAGVNERPRVEFMYRRR